MQRHPLNLSSEWRHKLCLLFPTPEFLRLSLLRMKPMSLWVKKAIHLPVWGGWEDPGISGFLYVQQMHSSAPPTLPCRAPSTWFLDARVLQGLIAWLPFLPAHIPFWSAHLGTMHLISTSLHFVEILYQLSVSLLFAFVGLCIFIKSPLYILFLGFQEGAEEYTSSISSFKSEFVSYPFKDSLSKGEGMRGWKRQFRSKKQQVQARTEMSESVWHRVWEVRITVWLESRL